MVPLRPTGGDSAGGDDVDTNLCHETLQVFPPHEWEIVAPLLITRLANLGRCLGQPSNSEMRAVFKSGRGHKSTTGNRPAGIEL